VEQYDLDVGESDKKIERLSRDADAATRRLEEAQLAEEQAQNTAESLREATVPLADRLKEVKSEFDEKKGELLSVMVSVEWIFNHDMS
jgi:uncharacterized coiled-coil DUF342 family protein